MSIRLILHEAEIIRAPIRVVVNAQLRVVCRAVFYRSPILSEFTRFNHAFKSDC